MGGVAGVVLALYRRANGTRSITPRDNPRRGVSSGVSADGSRVAVCVACRKPQFGSDPFCSETKHHHIWYGEVA